MIEYNKVNVKLTDSQRDKLKTSVENQTGATLRMNIKMINGNNFLVNYYQQQDKELSSEMHLKICQLT